MGVSEGVDGGELMDCSVGTIVWVRRRNGSWWPGRILGPHELSASHLMSPRSGTPVKLLGREDASVDWYNLEKSKRVKAFRCGEFDACIERAEASHGVPIKKREKYARREDAILHALELEKQQLEKQQRKSGSSPNYTSNKFVGALKKESSICSPLGIYSRNEEFMDHGRFVSPKPEPLSTVYLPLEAQSSDIPLHAQKGRNDKQLKWEDDNSEAVPRMRGLQDFGLRIAPSKKKLTNSCDSSQKLVSIDSHVHALSGSEYKRKRSQGGLVEESLVRRRDRRRPLVQVLQSSAKLQASHSLMPDSDTLSVMVQEEKDHMGSICRAKRSRCIYVPVESSDYLDGSGYSSDQMQLSALGCSNSGYPDFLAEENTSSASVEEDDSDLYERNSLDEDAEEDEALFPGTSQNPGSRNSGRYVMDDSSSFQVQEKFGYLNNDEKSLVSYKPHLHPLEQSAGTSADVGVSKWQMKGKRNIRNLSKKPIEVMDSKISNLSADKCNGSVYGTSYGSKRSTFEMGRERASGLGFYHKSEDYVYDEDDFVEEDPDTELTGFDKRRYSLMSKARLKVLKNNGVNDSDEDSHMISPEGWEADGLSHASRRAYWEESDECFDPVYADHINAGMESMLVDVNLTVQASYQGERVPLVSLMSRLNGKAIVGHPIQIQILDDGSSTDILSRDAMREDPTGIDGSSAPQPVWRTGRRTIMQRVPRPHPTPSALDGGETDLLPYPDFETKPALKRAYTAQLNHQPKLMNNSHRAVPGKLQKKLLKKVSLSSQKTRTLSSIATDPKRSGESGGSRRIKKTGGILDGLIKPDDSMPLVTCVPVKVVFSRILEAVGRAPSAAATHRVLLTSSANGNPS